MLLSSKHQYHHYCNFHSIDTWVCYFCLGLGSSVSECALELVQYLVVSDWDFRCQPVRYSNYFHVLFNVSWIIIDKVCIYWLEEWGNMCYLPLSFSPWSYSFLPKMGWLQRGVHLWMHSGWFSNLVSLAATVDGLTWAIQFPHSFITAFSHECNITVKVIVAFSVFCINYRLLQSQCWHWSMVLPVVPMSKSHVADLMWTLPPRQFFQ